MTDEAATVPGRRYDDDSTAMTVREMVLDHDHKLDGLLAWRSELRGAMALMKVAFGASIVSALVSILAVIQLVALHR